MYESCKNFQQNIGLSVPWFLWCSISSPFSPHGKSVPSENNLSYDKVAELVGILRLFHKFVVEASARMFMLAKQNMTHIDIELHFRKLDLLFWWEEKIFLWAHQWYYQWYQHFKMSVTLIKTAGCVFLLDCLHQEWFFKGKSLTEQLIALCAICLKSWWLKHSKYDGGYLNLATLVILVNMV